MIIFALAAFFIHSSHAKTLSSTVVYTLSWINCTACRVEMHVAFLRILTIEKTITCSDSCFRKKKKKIDRFLKVSFAKYVLIECVQSRTTECNLDLFSLETSNLRRHSLKSG